MTDFEKGTIRFDTTPASKVTAPNSSKSVKVFLDTDGKLKRINYDGTVEELSKEQEISYYQTNIEADADQTRLTFSIPNPLKAVLEAESRLKSLIDTKADKVAIEGAVSDLKGSIESWKSSQERANGVFDSSISEIENKVSEIDSALAGKTDSSDFARLQSDLTTIVTNINNTIASLATVKQLDAAIRDVKGSIPKIPEPINIVADSSNVTINKRGNEIGIEVDIPKVAQQVAQSGGGGGKGIKDAPKDGNIYGRQDGEWVEVSGAGVSAGIQGRFQLDAVNTTFTINHSPIDEASEYPVASLEVADANSDLHILGIHDRTATSFKVTLSGVANANTYILWHISTQSAPGMTTIASSGGSIVVTQVGDNFNLEVADNYVIKTGDTMTGPLVMDNTVIELDNGTGRKAYLDADSIYIEDYTNITAGNYLEYYYDQSGDGRWTFDTENGIAFTIERDRQVNFKKAISVFNLSGVDGNIVTHDANGKLLDSGVNIASISGDYVNVTGDTMTGDLTMNSGSKVNTPSINNGGASISLDGLGVVMTGYGDTLTISNTAINSGIFGNVAWESDVENNRVAKAGDTMTGDLTMDGGAKINTPSIYNGGTNIILDGSYIQLGGFDGATVTFTSSSINHSVLGDVAFTSDLGNYVQKAGDTMTGDLTITTIADAGAGSLVSVTNTGKLENSGISLVEATTKTFGVVIDGGGTVPVSGSMGYWTVPVDGVIESWTILGDTTGSCVVDVRKSDYSTFPTTTTIAGTAKPTLSSAQKNQDTSLVNWGNPNLTAGDVVEFYLESASTLTRINVVIKWRVY